MEYEKSMLLEEDDSDGSSEAELEPTLLEMEDEELDTWPDDLALDDALNKKSKVSPVRFSLKERRRIEEIQEERRLRKEFDYYELEEVSENNDVTKSE